MNGHTIFNSWKKSVQKIQNTGKDTVLVQCHFIYIYIDIDILFYLKQINVKKRFIDITICNLYIGSSKKMPHITKMRLQSLLSVSWSFKIFPEKMRQSFSDGWLIFSDSTALTWNSNYYDKSRFKTSITTSNVGNCVVPNISYNRWKILINDFLNSYCIWEFEL